MAADGSLSYTQTFAESGKRFLIIQISHQLSFGSS